MSVNWVMLHDKDAFVRLPNERHIYTSPPRTSLLLSPPTSYSGRETLNVQSSSGCVYLTNQRVVYLPANKTADFQSFSAPLLRISDSHVSAPFFGPNVWTALIQPVSGGGIPASLPAVQLKLTFKDGGAFDFHSNFERIKDRLLQTVETSELRGGRHAQDEVDFSRVHLDELPAYDGPRSGSDGHVYSAHPLDSHHARDQGGPNQDGSQADGIRFRGRDQGPEIQAEPMEPPPGYEEAQQQCVAEVVEERLRGSS